jgi:hypothetical protein
MFFARPAIQSEALVVEAGSILLSVHVAGSEHSLVGFGKSTIPLNFAQSVSCLQSKVEIKCMDHISEKTPTELKPYSF